MREHVGVRAIALALALALSRVAGRAVLRGVVDHPATAGGRWSAGLLSVGHGGGVVVYVRGAVAGVMETCKRGIAVLLHAFTGHTKTNTCVVRCLYTCGGIGVRAAHAAVMKPGSI